MKPLAPIHAFVILTFTSCMSVPQIEGDHALRRSDIQQIQGLVASRSDIKKPISTIRMLASDRAEISSGKTAEDGGLISVFTVYRKAGRWFIHEPSIHEERVVVVEKVRVGYIAPSRPNQSLQLTVGRFGASHDIMKKRPFQSTLALASGS